jgi:hypothetical protein
MPSTDSEFRPLMIRARTLGRTLLQVYRAEGDATPAELVDLLDIAEQRLARAGYKIELAAGEGAAASGAAASLETRLENRPENHKDR